MIDNRISNTYAKDSKASNKNKLSDAYVKFFRWATDRLQGRDGVVCMVTNNSFTDQIAFDGMRQHLLNDFTAIYHIDLHGNVRQNPKLSGTTHNVFGIQVGVGITVAIRSSSSPVRGIYYVRVPEDWRKDQKLEYLKAHNSIGGIDWQQLNPDDQNNWRTDELRSEFGDFMPFGSQEAKASGRDASMVIFSNYSLGVSTNRANWCLNFDKQTLKSKVELFIDTYNGEVDRWKRTRRETSNVDDFVIYDDARIKWSEGLKLDLKGGHYAEFSDTKIRSALYRPFCRQWLFFDSILNERRYQFPRILPTPATEKENQFICTASVGADHLTFHASNTLVDLKYGINGNSGIQCFPYYVYNEDGSGRRENITDWALARFAAAYGPAVTKRDIFHYVYGVLHHPFYRERYAANLKRELPRIPLVAGADAFREVVRIGGELSALHLGYEQVQEYPLTKREAPGERLDWRVGEKKMRLNAEKTALAYNDWLTLEGIPPEVYRYRLGNRSALEWVIDQHHISTDRRSGITSDPNRADDPQYIVRLIGQVVTVSVATVRLVDELAGIQLVAEDVLAGGA